MKMLSWGSRLNYHNAEPNGQEHVNYHYRSIRTENQMDKTIQSHIETGVI